MQVKLIKVEEVKEPPAILKKAEVLEQPEYRGWYADPSIRTPMDVTYCWDGHELVMQLRMKPVGKPDAETFIREMQHWTEKLNKTISLMATQGVPKG